MAEWENPFLRRTPADPMRLTLREQMSLAQAPRLPARVPDWISNPPPRNYDFRGADEGRRRLSLSTFKPGDVLQTDGADVRIRWNGAPAVTLRPGFENGRDAARKGPVLVPPAPPAASVEANMKMAAEHTPFWFLKQVPNKQPWDYKQQGSKYEPFGNFNYGAAGRAGRLPEEALLRGAGWAQQRAGTSRNDFGNPYLGTSSYGDDPADQYWIEQGVRHHRQR